VINVISNFRRHIYVVSVSGFTSLNKNQALVRLIFKQTKTIVGSVDHSNYLALMYTFSLFILKCII